MYIGASESLPAALTSFGQSACTMLRLAAEPLASWHTVAREQLYVFVSRVTMSQFADA